MERVEERKNGKEREKTQTSKRRCPPPPADDSIPLSIRFLHLQSYTETAVRFIHCSEPACLHNRTFPVKAPP